jgi:hypothetical protein
VRERIDGRGGALAACSNCHCPAVPLPLPHPLPHRHHRAGVPRHTAAIVGQLAAVRRPSGARLAADRQCLAVCTVCTVRWTYNNCCQRSTHELRIAGARCTRSGIMYKLQEGRRGSFCYYRLYYKQPPFLCSHSPPPCSASASVRLQRCLRPSPLSYLHLLPRCCPPPPLTQPPSAQLCAASVARCATLLPLPVPRRAELRPPPA